MRRSLFFLIVIFCHTAGFSQAQNLPYISTPSIIPQFPTSSDYIKIATRVTTPNQGIIVDVNTFTVTQNPKEILIRGCFWQGMATAVQIFVDTLMIGPLPQGTYVVKQKAYLSSTQQHCSPTDSNMVSTTLAVVTVTDLKESKINMSLSVFPVPASEVLHVENATDYKYAEIFSSTGALVMICDLEESSAMNIHKLTPGLYFVRCTNEDKSVQLKFIKE